MPADGWHDCTGFWTDAYADQLLPQRGRSACWRVLRARRKECLRIVAVAHGQTMNIPTGRGINRWHANSTTDFPS